MNVRFYPLALNMAFVASLGAFVTGCNRVETPAQAPIPPSTSVGTEIDDTVVTSRVKSALMGNQDVKSSDIKVETRKGVVQLSGFVDSQTQVDRAVAVARAVEGAKGVENAMTLKQGKLTVGNAIDDSVLTAKVKSALLSDPGVKSFDIAVVTRKGTVQLSGYVDNNDQVNEAIRVSRGVEGVQGVVNEMTVKK